VGEAPPLMSVSGYFPTLNVPDEYGRTQLLDAQARFERFARWRARGWVAFFAAPMFVGAALACPVQSRAQNALFVFAWASWAGASAMIAASRDRNPLPSLIASVFFACIPMLTVWLATDYGYGKARERIEELTRKPAPRAISSLGMAALVAASVVALIGGIAIGTWKHGR
jgi:hypothetical protein